MISAIVPVGGNDPKRIANFRFFINCIAEQDYEDFELIVAEMVYKEPVYMPMVPNAGKRTVRILVPGEQWSRTILNNEAARQAKGDILLFFDADISFGKWYFSFIAKCFGDHTDKYIIGWDKSIWLNESGREKYLSAGIYNPHIDKESIKVVKFVDDIVTSCKGLCVGFRSDFFREKLAGFHPGFRGWGSGDCSIAYRAKYFSGQNNSTAAIPYTVVHLWHGDRHYHPPNRDILTRAIFDPIGLTKDIRDLLSEGEGDK